MCNVKKPQKNAVIYGCFVVKLMEKTCIEYVETKVGIPLMTACRLSQAEEKLLNEQDIIKP